MQHLTTTPSPRNIVPDTVETVVRTDDDILLWVEDAPITPCKWDDFEGEPTAELTTAALREEQPREVDFMNEVADRLQANGATGLHEDVEDGEEPHTEQIGFMESRYPFRF